MKYVIIGASAAGINAAKTLRVLDKDAEITLISKDTKVYSRCMLHYVISGNKTEEDICFTEDDFFNKYEINWISGKKIIGINIYNKFLTTDDERIVTFDKLLIASGADSFIPKVKNLRGTNNVYALRHMEDVVNINSVAKINTSAVIIGAGLVGIDAAIGLIEKGVKVNIVEMAPGILPIQLDAKTAKVYENELIKNGAQVYTSVSVEEIIIDENKDVKAVKLGDGREINCDFIICAAGVRPNVDFLKDNRIKMEKGIVIDSRCKTSVEDIYAAGDVCGISPIWPMAVKQGIVAAYNMTGNLKELDDYFSFKNSMNFFGIQTVSLGVLEAPDNTYEVEVRVYKDIYKKIIHKDGVIYGAILQGDISYCGILTELIKNKIDVSKINKSVLDINYGDFYKVNEDGQYIY
ncbi:NAD(P)/FAD-dependent oxidoreductase [Clostridium tagluense]|uniref:NAD(P)/FAD-dependent oxidoreductase n=1 Tax=Clostridium tagluense TaxID=360422 RepID=UPI001C6E3623|nr:FAD-dependent oxidoreductase [Clostridium tagluense]MBW9155279.1 FAD-dependent oxidoreductase [Clostridium tagluense]WLC67801.1 FAD-dependent oxidoreductase [Clostridium tagluense]